MLHGHLLEFDFTQGHIEESYNIRNVPNTPLGSEGHSKWTQSFGTKPFSWWRHQMETFSALLAICAGNSPVPGEFPTQRPVTRSFDVFFDLRLNKRLIKQSRGWWLETLSRPLWRHRNVSIKCVEKWILFAGIMSNPCNFKVYTTVLCELGICG